MDCYIVDIDGTVANIDHRLSHILKTEPDWDSFHDQCHLDQPIESVINIVKLLADSSVSVIYCTGRWERNRLKTQAWLEQQWLPWSPLYMRKDGDHRPDTIVKREMAEEIKGQGYKIIGVFEDRPSVCRMWREMGITCFQLTDKEF